MSTETVQATGDGVVDPLADRLDATLTAAPLGDTVCRPDARP